MDIINNDLIKLFESYYRFKEKYGEIADDTFMHSIHAGIAGLEVQGKRQVIEHSIEDFRRISSFIQDAYDSIYNSPLQQRIVQESNREDDVLTLDEVIKEYRLTSRIKDRKWRADNPDFPFFQPTGNRGTITCRRGDIEKYKSKRE